MVVLFVKSEDPDQMPRSAASDLGSGVGWVRGKRGGVTSYI